MTSPPGTPLVLFDCDGVLVDSEPLVQRVEMRMIAALGWPITPEEVLAEHMGRSWATVETNIERHIGRPVPEDFNERRVADTVALFEQELQAIRGVQAATAALTDLGHPTCVASSSAPWRIELVLRLTGQWDTFEGRIFSASEVEHGKPAPDLFLHAARRMGADPAACIVVEDSPPGVAAGRAAGMSVVGFAGATPAGLLDQAHVVITDMSELPDAVQSLR